MVAVWAACYAPRVKLLVLASLLALAFCLPRTAHCAAADSSGIYPNEEALRHYVAGLALEEGGDPGEALREFYRALALDPHSIAALRHVSELAARQGDVAQSQEFAERGLALAPHDGRLLWLKGAALFNGGHPADALPVLEAALDADSGQVEYARTLAHVAEALGRTSVVARAWRRTTALEEEDGEAWFQLAAAETRLGHFTAAERALATARDLAPERPGLTFLEGWIREGQGRRPEAIELFRKHLATHADDLATRRRLVQLLARERRWDEAYHEAHVVSAAQPEDFVALEVETDLAFRAKRRPAAEALLPKLEAVAGRDPDRILRVVGLLGRNGRGPQGVALADRWGATAPAGEREQMAAQSRALIDDTRGALVHARLAIIAEPDSLAPRQLAASLFQTRHEYAAAESAWTDGLGRGADSLSTLLSIAFCREQLGDIPGAEHTVRDALRIDPGNPRTLNFLGYLLADHSRALDEALQLIQRALELDPDNGAYIDSLGWVYYRLGRLPESRQQLERAVQLTDGDPVVREHLGDVYKELKMLEMARQQYRLGLAADASNTKLKAKLAQIR